MERCSVEGNFLIDGRERSIRCTLPDGHDDWHAYSEHGVTMLTWQGDRPLGTKTFEERIRLG